ncbi:T9SS type A sorting domain-containing protein [Neolewinella lacunae]|uniref:T9SS type A sorting domain-containing protein n=1 Tax=Neolewinella lacunae TaxID=1517758 RepID=A0A923PR51_9BACT|nr:T9SS type A sorting domain-containing protein [Neolewinella lacunae]MBC6995943.1 T9SS type A sorting domain-containing protein [Neolewinella lacunae]MDN3635213.1 T9SS type A sorting domain-containing protein [Neolewinella lacunae]
MKSTIVLPPPPRFIPFAWPGWRVVRKFFPLLAALLGAVPATGQLTPLIPAYPPVSTTGGRDLPLAWFGGLNSPQPQLADLDGDGTDDLFVFDRAGNIALALRGLGGDRYDEAPALTAHFPPEITNWMMLRDYNHDDVPDIFTYAAAVDGIAVYRGHRRSDGLLGFTLVDFGDPLPQLYFPFSGVRTPVFVSSIDYPAVEDVDFDGDLDILTFAVAGGHVEYYRNVAVERGFGADTLIYTLEDQCWGGFFESGLTTALDLADRPDACSDGLLGSGRPRHSGSTMLALDYDGNGRTDLMLGDISFDALVLALNTGTRDQAWITSQDSVWNTNGVAVNINSFPAAFHLDADQDGARDLIVSPSIILNGEDVNVTWLYRNVGSDAAPDFRFQTRRFLIEDMIDFGTSANVSVFDADGDGRPDLVIGNNNAYTGTNLLSSQLRLFRNDGAGGFTLADGDYLGLTAFMSTTWAFAPAFGDLDGDGDDDVVLGERSGRLIYGENTAGQGNPATFAPLQFEWQDIDAGQFSKPFLADLDRDGRTDLLVGGFDGRIRFYRNVGSRTNPVFNPDPTAPGNMLQLGGINTNAPGVSTGHPNPWVLQYRDHTLVLSGNRSGTIEAYRFGVDTAHTAPFKLLTKAIGGLDVGTFSNPGLADFDGDGLLDLVLGNERGGVSFYRTALAEEFAVGLFAAEPPSFDFQVFPNPAVDVLTLSGWPAGGVATLELLDVTGRLLQRTTLPNASGNDFLRWPLGGYPPGVYLVRASGPAGVALRRVVVR